MSNFASDNSANKSVIGVLALQGDFEAHYKMLTERLGAAAIYVRTPDQLATVDALILPGGESTAIAKLMNRIGLDSAIKERAKAGMPIYGTCAGLILLARSIEARPDQPTLGLMDITVARNAFGRQIDSFEADIPFVQTSMVQTQMLQTPMVQTQMDQTANGRTNAEPEIVRGVFIRAPYVAETAPEVQILGRFRDKIVCVRQGNLFGTAFHPELTSDPRVHAYFVRMVTQSHHTADVGASLK